MDNIEKYDFLINDEDEAMLLLYVHEGEPDNPTIELDVEDKTAILNRNAVSSITLEDISDEVFDSLEDSDTLLVCELSLDENEEDTSIVYAYEAEITD